MFSATQSAASIRSPRKPTTSRRAIRRRSGGLAATAGDGPLGGGSDAGAPDAAAEPGGTLAAGTHASSSRPPAPRAAALRTARREISKSSAIDRRPSLAASECPVERRHQLFSERLRRQLAADGDPLRRDPYPLRLVAPARGAGRREER